MHSLSLFLFRSNCTSSHEKNLRWKMNSSQVWTKYNLNSTTVFLNESPWNCFVFEKWKRKGKREGFFVHANWPIAFFKGQTTHPFLSSPPFIRSTLPSFLLSPFASWILAESTLQGKGGRNERRRNGGYQMYGNKEEAGLNSGEWTLLSKGNVDGIPLLLQCMAEPDTFHYVPLCPMDILSAFLSTVKSPATTDISLISRDHFIIRHD